MLYQTSQKNMWIEKSYWQILFHSNKLKLFSIYHDSKLEHMWAYVGICEHIPHFL